MFRKKEGFTINIANNSFVYNVSVDNVVNIVAVV